MLCWAYTKRDIENMLHCMAPPSITCGISVWKLKHVVFKQASAFIQFIVLYFPVYIWVHACTWASDKYSSEIPYLSEYKHGHIFSINKFLTWHLNESSIYSDPACISYHSLVQGTMAGANIGVYKFGSMVRGQHVYKSVWLTKLVSASCGKTTNVTNTL